MRKRKDFGGIQRLMRVFYSLGAGLIFLALGIRVGLTKILKISFFSQGQVLLLVGLIGLGVVLILTGWIVSSYEEKNNWIGRGYGRELGFWKKGERKNIIMMRL